MSLNRGNAGPYAIAFLAFSLLTLSGAGFFSFLVWERYDSRGWPHVPGSVIASYSTHTCGSGKSGHTWEAKIVYRYLVDEHTHKAGRVGNYRIYCDDNRKDVNDWLKDHYPLGKAIEVYYNPSDHDAAFLSPGQIAKMDIAMVVALLIISCLMAWGARLSLRLIGTKSGNQLIAGAPGVRERIRFKVTVSFGDKHSEEAIDPHSDHKG